MGNDPILPVSQTRVRTSTLWSPLLAPGIGIEPILAESKSVVLPLHYPGIKLVATDNFEMSTYRLSSDYSASELRGNIGIAGGTRTHGFTDLQSGTMATLSPLYKIGIPPRIRTLSSGFGDRYAAVNTRDTYWRSV